MQDYWQRAQAYFNILLDLRQYEKDAPTDPLIRFLAFCAENKVRSHAQFFQDLFVLFLLRSKRGGFFVEFGATNGIDLSNTYLLEKDYKWRGLLAEPAKCWHGALKANRKCKIDTRCVWNTTGEILSFSEVGAAEFSTATELKDNDLYKDVRKDSKEYAVETISLNDFLILNEAPKQIDYLSIDTEGSELRIIRSLDFSKYDPKIITIEHNYTADREEIRVLLQMMGYVRVFDPFTRWDDWYVKENVLVQAGWKA